MQATLHRFTAVLRNALLLTMMMLIAVPAFAQDDDRRKRGKRRGGPRSQPTSTQASKPTTTSTSTSTAASAEAEEEEEDKPEYLAVINARAHTVTDGTFDDVTILCKDGVIADIGPDVHVPDEAEVVDAAGYEVFPGLVACSSSGIFGGGDPRDTSNVFGLNMQIGLAGGITTAVAGNNAAKLTYGTLDGLLIRKDLFVNLRYSSNRPLDKRQLRADFEKVRGYLRDLRRYQLNKEHDKDAEEPDKSWLKGKYENYRKLIAGERVALASARDVADIRAFCELADQYGFELVLRGADEAWTIPGELGRANVSAIVTPRSSRRPDERLNRPSGSSIENAAILRRHGVTVAVVPASTGITLWGVAGRDLLHLNLEAAFAVRGGMRNDDALRTITIDAARILGIDDRVGSLEVGKDADLILCDGDILSYMTQVHTTIVNGKVAYTKGGSSLYAHIRPEGEPVETTFDDQWPRQLKWTEEAMAASAPKSDEEEADSASDDTTEDSQ